MRYGTIYISPLGPIRLLSNGKDLIEVHTDFWKGRKLSDVSYEDDTTLPCIQETIRWLDIYFAGNEPDFLPPLAPQGSSFRKAVWEILLSIPYGKVMTYGEIAQILAATLGMQQMSAQAVGGAVGANPIGIIIPCHRVIGANGNLTGYAGGLRTKIDLLKLEGINTDNLILPPKSKFL